MVDTFGTGKISDAFVIDTAAEIIGYSRGMVLSHIQQNHIDAVRISGKYIISKAAIVDFLVSDIAKAPP